MLLLFLVPPALPSPAFWSRRCPLLLLLLLLLIPLILLLLLLPLAAAVATWLNYS